jgi:hypothetical protein
VNAPDLGAVFPQDLPSGDDPLPMLSVAVSLSAAALAVLKAWDDWDGCEFSGQWQVIVHTINDLRPLFPDYIPCQFSETKP